MLAIARAKTWMQHLRDGEYRDTAEIARRFKLNDAHVRRLLRFGYLAPDIVEAIVEGRQPRSLTVRRLLQGIPSAWADQRTRHSGSHTDNGPNQFARTNGCQIRNSSALLH